MMSRRGWLNLALLLLLLALAALAYLEPGTKTEPPLRLTTLDAATVQRMRLERPQAESIVLQRQDDGEWRMTEPVAVMAGRFQVARLLDLLTQASLQQYPVQDLELGKYGLQPPQARLLVDGVELAFGKINPLNNRLYVRVDDVMHMVAHTDISWLTGAWPEFVSNALLPDAALLRLELPGLGTLQREADGWRYEGATAPQSADQMQALVDSWRHARALRVRPQQALDVADEVVVRLGSGQVLNFALWQTDEELVLQRPDLGLEYVFDTAQAQRLLRWPPLAGDDSEQGEVEDV